MFNPMRPGAGTPRPAAAAEGWAEECHPLLVFHYYRLRWLAPTTPLAGECADAIAGVLEKHHPRPAAAETEMRHELDVGNDGRQAA